MVDRTPSIPPRRPARRPRPRQRATWGFALLSHCAHGLLLIGLAAGAVLAVAYVRLAHGPVSLPILVRTIEHAVGAELVGTNARLADAQLAFGLSGGLELRLIDLKLSQLNGDVVARVPSAAVELSRAALWSMTIAPSRIELIEPRVFLAYTQATGLKLSFDSPDAIGAIDAPKPSPPAPSSGPPRSTAAIFKDAVQQVRQQLKSSAYLRQIGIRDAIVTLDNEGVRSQLNLLEGSIDLNPEQNGQAALLKATMASEAGPWSLELQCDSLESGRPMKLSAGTSGLIPRGLASTVAPLRSFRFIDAPIEAKAAMEISSDGRVSSGSITLNVGHGQIALPAAADLPIPLEQGRLALSFDGASQRFELQPSSFDWAGGHVGFSGYAALEPSTDQPTAWMFNAATQGGQLSADDPAAPPLKLDRGILRGRIVPSSGEVRLDELSLKAGGAEFSGHGLFEQGVRDSDGGAQFEGKLGPTSASDLLALWPKTLSKPTRQWIAEHVRRGYVKSGSLTFASGSFAQDSGAIQTPSGPRRVTLAAEVADVQCMPLKWLPPIEAARGFVQIENNSLDVTVPDAAVVVAANRRISIKGGRMTSSNLNAPVTTSEISFHSLSSLAPVLEVLDMSPLHVLKSNGLTIDGVDGKVDGQMKLFIPLIPDLDAKEVKIEAKARVMDARAKQFLGAYDIAGGSVSIDVTPASIDAKGDMLVNGVPAKLGWQHILESDGDKQPQPPLRISASLDNADRTQLGIDVNQFLLGEVPVEILVEKNAQDENSVRLRADLTNAEIVIDSIAWHKAPGRAATLQADIVKGKAFKYELQNLRIVGDDLTLEGTAGIGADNRLHEINLPGVQLNVITRLGIQAVLKSEVASDHTGLWQVKIKGENLDGRDLFRSLFAVGPAKDKGTAATGKPSPGVDIEGDIENVIGHGEVSVRGVHFKVVRRADKLTMLDARGTLDGGAAVTLSLAARPGDSRHLLANTSDAGQALKLIGLYPNMQGGQGNLDVNVDGRGSAEKTGVLSVRNFKILGDPVVADVLGNTPTGTGEPAAVRRARKQDLVREVLDFDTMEVPFAIGYGQFVVENASLHGPLLGVSLVGKADFKLRTLEFGGTYTPLQGLNNLLGDVPLVGGITSGFKSEGTFGITFAVQGPMAQPQVLVNPLSLLTPGFTRELMQMTNPNPKVIPREDKATAPPVEKRVRASSSGGADATRATKSAPTATAKATEPGQVDGWNQGTQTAPAKSAPH